MISKHAINRDRLGDVLDLVPAKVFVTQIELLLDLFEYRPGERYTTRFGNGSWLAKKVEKRWREKFVENSTWWAP